MRWFPRDEHRFPDSREKGCRYDTTCCVSFGALPLINSDRGASRRLHGDLPRRDIQRRRAMGLVSVSATSARCGGDSVLLVPTGVLCGGSVVRGARCFSSDNFVLRSGKVRSPSHAGFGQNKFPLRNRDKPPGLSRSSGHPIDADHDPSDLRTASAGPVLAEAVSFSGTTFRRLRNSHTDRSDR